jgi:hypothetical protein
MFNTKKSNLSTFKTKTTQPFVNAASNTPKMTTSGNGAVKFESSGSPFVDQFAVSGAYKNPRSFTDIANDCEALWSENKLDAVKFSLFLRMITRKTVDFDGRKTQESQRGVELRHEALTRMLWLYNRDRETFWANLPLFVASGCWKDVITMLRMDLEYHDVDGRILDWDRFANFIISGLNNESQVNLVKKYLPQIKSKSKCTTVHSQANYLIGMAICEKLFGDTTPASLRKYRQMKASGTAHQWQQLISKGQFDLIDFNTVCGRALSQLVKSKFLKNHDLSDKYSEWVGDQITVKYTGFVHELFHKLNWHDSNVIETVNKQFAELIAKGEASEHQSKLIVVRDTSGSMSCGVDAKSGMTANHIAASLALYFSEFLDGPFAGHWIDFNRTATMMEWKGNTPCEKFQNSRGSGCMSNTNFQSVIDLFVNIKQQSVAEEHFPTGILCLSDGEFDQAELSQTNVQAARNKLRSAGFSQEFCDSFQIILWNIVSRAYGNTAGRNNFETQATAHGTYYFGGYSGSVIQFLTDEVKTSEQLIAEALDQEILNHVTLA